MVIVMQKHASDQSIEHVVAELSSRGFDVHRSTGSDQTVLGVVGGIGRRSLANTSEPFEALRPIYS